MIEFTGVAQMITGHNLIRLTLPETATYRDIVRILGMRFPELVGVLIDPAGDIFLSSNMFIINGEMGNPAMMMDKSPKNGDRLVLMSVITGG
jgi:hypothetical protein